MPSRLRRVVLFLFVLFSFVACQRGEKAPPPIQGNWTTPVAATETFYRAIDREDFALAWRGLSEASRERFTAALAAEAKLELPAARELFEKNAPSLKSGFWASFRRTSSIPMLMPQARFELLSEGPERARVRLTSGSIVVESTAVKEQGEWRMGYAESFME